MRLHLTARQALVALFSVLALAACSKRREPPPPAEGVHFTDITEAAGIRFEHETGFDDRYWFPEIVGPGCAVFDFDEDDRLDIFFVNGGFLTLDAAGRAAPHPPHALYRNTGDGRFEDVTERAGVGGAHYGQGCAVGDYDGDGDPDLYVTNVGPDHLYRNNGDGTFTDVATAAGIAAPGWSTSAAFADLDGDRDLDLFVTSYCIWSQAGQVPCRSAKGEPDYCNPSAFEPAADHFFRNRGDGTFEDTTRDAGLHVAYGHGLGVLAADFDGDGRRDLFVANDGDANNLWLAQEDGTFRDEGALTGAALNAVGNAEASMGVTIADLGADGDWDIFLTHMTGETNTLYINDSSGFFEDVTQARGLGAPSMTYTGFGTLFFDADRDADVDLFIVNGAVIKGDGADRSAWPYAQRDQFFESVGGRFEELSPEEAGWLAPEAVSRGAAFGDLDGDGDIDIVVANAGSPPRVLRNDTALDDRHWLGVELRAQAPNRYGIGAVVSVTAEGAPWQQQRIARDGSFASANEPRVVFGFPPQTTGVGIGVRWPDGTTEHFTAPGLDRDIILERGTGTPGALERGAVPAPRGAAPRATTGGSPAIAATAGIPELPALDTVDASIAQRVRDAHTALVGDPSSAAAWKGYGVALYADVSAYESSAHALQQAVALAPDDARSVYLWALAAMQLGDQPTMRAQLVRTLELDDYTPARIRLAELDIDDRRLDEAEAHYRHVLEDAPDQSFALEGLGRVQRLKGMPDAAVDNLSMAVEIAPRSRKARYELGLAWRELGDMEQAREHLEAAQELEVLPMNDPWLAELHEGRGGDQSYLTAAHQARRAGDLDRALELYTEYANRKPADAVGWANLAAISRDLGRDAEALAAAERALSIDPSRAETWALQGTLLAAAGRRDEAIGALDRAVEVNPGLAQAWFDRGVLLQAARRYPEATEAFGKYVALRPADVEGLVKLGEARIGTGDFTGAAETFEQVFAMEPGHAVAHFRSAGLALRDQDSPGAIRHFDQALAARPGWPEAHFGRALAHRSAGDTNAALSDCEEAVRLRPENARFQRLLKELRDSTDP